jgi:hypothetical protein
MKSFARNGDHADRPGPAASFRSLVSPRSGPALAFPRANMGAATSWAASSAWPSRAGRWRTGPRLARTVRRSASTATFSTFRVGEGLRSTGQPVSKTVALGLPSFVVHVAKPGDRRRAQGDAPN